jgi:hypothetical protein
MRNDISKLVTERPRHGRGRAVTKKYGGRVHIIHDPDHDYCNEIGGFHSSSRHRQQNYKAFSDSLSAIEGNLRKNVGRHWDEVHSEFCAVMDRRGLAGWHVYAQHLMRDVEQKVYMGADGKVYEYGAGIQNNLQEYDYKLKKWVDNPDGHVWLRHDIEVTGYYVHPLTGILCHRKRNGYQDPYEVYRKQKHDPKPLNYISIKNDSMYRALRIDEASTYSYRSIEKGKEYYFLENCGHSPKNRFQAWFHYRIKTITKIHWKPVGFVIAKNAHFTGDVINKVSPKMELYYRARPDQYTKKEDGWWYERIKETTEKTIKRSCNREQLARIREFLNRI